MSKPPRDARTRCTGTWNAFPDAPLPADAGSSPLQPPANPSHRRTVTGSRARHRNSAQTLDPLRLGDRPGRRKTNHPACSAQFAPQSPPEPPHTPFHSRSSRISGLRHYLTYSSTDADSRPALLSVPVDEVLEIAFADSHATPKTVSPQFSALDPSPDGLGADFQPVRDGRDRRQCQSPDPRATVRYQVDPLFTKGHRRNDNPNCFTEFCEIPGWYKGS